MFKLRKEKGGNMKKIFVCLISIVMVAVFAQAGYCAKKRICVMDLEDKAEGQHGGWRSPGKGMWRGQGRISA